MVLFTVAYSKIFYLFAIHCQQLLAATRIRSPLKIGTLIQHPMVYIKPGTNETSSPVYVGYEIDLIKELARRLDFDYQLIVRSDKQHGIKLSDGGFNGVIGDVVSGRVDMALAALSILSDRVAVVDFTTSYMQLEMSMIMKVPPPGRKLLVNSLDSVFQPGITFASIVNSMVGITVIGSKYSVYSRLEHSENLEVSKGVFLPRAINATLEDSNFVFIFDSPCAEQLTLKYCELITVPTEKPLPGYAIALPKGSALKLSLDAEILAMTDNGTLDMLYEKYFKDAKSCQERKLCTCHTGN
jgi:ABC-type amino acid transport substrate-binding protein